VFFFLIPPIFLNTTVRFGSTKPRLIRINGRIAILRVLEKDSLSLSLSLVALPSSSLKRKRLSLFAFPSQ
jgi:hypothetical protein